MIINKIKTNINVKQSVVLLFLLMIPQIAFCDDLQNTINRDYFRTPEAAAFKKYGEEAVNEYTGTADISVPLYTIKSKDIEIPLVLRYDASGIKVEQEASWVGLGWNLMVGGCINYVCAGGHDMYKSEQVENKAWTEYLTSEFGPWTVGDSIIDYRTHSIFFPKTLQQVDSWASRSRILYYTYDPQETSNWMAKLPLRYQNFVDSYVDVFFHDGMDKYIDWGYGERDFYSVNVMGKSFMFFIDPATLKVFNIGKAGEDFVVYPGYGKSSFSKGIGNQPDVENWKIIDSDGYIYKFTVGDKFKMDSRTGLWYTSWWYLTEIQSPMGETATFEYAELEKSGRQTLAESVKLPFFHDLGAFCCGDAANQIRTSYSNPLQSENNGMSVKSHYLSKIRTSNQTVTFYTSNDNKCSGKKLDAIKVVSYDGTTIKNINFSYGSFTSSNIGGNYAPGDPSIKSPDRLKLNNVKETVSGDTLTTSFSYNEKKQLPSKRSYAQDYWGYYNGRENKVGNKYTMIPTPRHFMSSHYVEKALSQYSDIGGADRNSRGEYMQAAILNKVVYPTGGYTTYEYEPNTCGVDLADADIPYDVTIYKDFSYTPDVPAGTKPVSNEPYNFTLTESLDYKLEVRCNGDAINGSSISIIIVSMTLAGTPILFPLKYQNLDSYITVDEGTLPAGNYQLLIGAPSVGNKGYGISCKLTGYYKSTRSAKTYTKAVGGLRIAKISNFDHNNTPINYTTYSYDGGILLNRIETIDYMRVFNGNPKPGNYSIGNISHYIDVYTITSGHPHMPAFFASCNPGIVGYSKVTKKKYSANASLEKSVVTSYMNNGPTNMYGIDYYTGFNNGMILSQEIRNASGAVVATTKNDYVVENVDHYATNIIAKQKYVGALPGGSSIPYYEFQERHDKTGAVTREKVTLYARPGSYDILRYPYILSRVELAKTTTTETGPSGSVVSTKEYKYNPINHQVSQIDENTGLPNQFRRTKIRYSADGKGKDNDNISNSMKNAHWLNNVIENKVFLVENNQEKNCISTQHTYYDMINSSSCFLPKSYATSIGSNALETRAKYSYDKKGNISSIEVDGIETVYIWSYLGHYPIAKIEGLTLAAIGESTINSLLDKAAPTASDLSSLRTKINSAGGHITTYTFKPLVGMTSQTLPNGLTVNYEYDAFGRLTKASDPQGVMQKYRYNYKKSSGK